MRPPRNQPAVCTCYLSDVQMVQPLTHRCWYCDCGLGVGTSAAVHCTPKSARRSSIHRCALLCTHLLFVQYLWLHPQARYRPKRSRSGSYHRSQQRNALAAIACLKVHSWTPSTRDCICKRPALLFLASRPLECDAVLTRLSVIMPQRPIQL